MGNVNIPPEDFKDQNVRIQISMKVPFDLLKAYREEALKQKKGYQTLMQETLRKAIPFNQQTQLSAYEIEAFRLGVIKIENVEHRLESIEKKLPKLKRA